MTVACVDEINSINVIVCVPRPIQHLLQPSVRLAVDLKGYEGGRQKERDIVPC